MQEQCKVDNINGSTIDVQRIIYERHLKVMEKRKGLDRGRIIRQTNNPERYNRISNSKKVST